MAKFPRIGWLLLSCTLILGALPAKATVIVRTLEEARRVVAGLLEHPYDENDPLALYGDDGAANNGRVSARVRNACDGVYTPAATARRLERVFVVSRFGALGTGTSRHFGKGEVVPGDPAPSEPPFRAGSPAMMETDPIDLFAAARWRERNNDGDTSLHSRLVSRQDGAPVPRDRIGRQAENTRRYIDRLAATFGGASSHETTGSDVLSGLRASDEWDWIGIQAAIVAAHEGGGGTVIIPDTGSDYLINRGLWLYSNVSLVWLTDPEKARHSYVRLTEPTHVVGSAIGPYNPYRPSPPRNGRPVATGDGREAIDDNRFYRASGFLCRVALIEPRVSSILGENAVSFALGSYGVNILGGHLRGARFNTPGLGEKSFNPEGGKAIQLESGVQQVEVRGTVLSDSTVGISSSSGYFLKVRKGNPGQRERFQNASDRISIHDVTFDRVEMPFFFSGVGYEGAAPGAASIAPQSVTVEGYIVRNSGVLKTPPRVPYEDEAASLQAGIVNLFAASNITIRGRRDGTTARVFGDTEIGSFVRGFGRNIDIAGVEIAAPFRNLVDTHTAFGRTSSRPRLEDFSLTATRATGRFEHVLRVPAVPGGNGRRPLLRNVRIVVSTPGGLVGDPLAPEVRRLPAAELNPPNLVIQLPASAADR